MIALIVAMTKNRVIGKNKQLPWHISGDLKQFKRTTTENTVIMGRHTYESIGKPLPNRHNIVISSTATIAGVDVCPNIKEGLAKAQSYGKDIFIIGGGTIYEQTIDLVDTMYISYVKEEYEGDTYFPAFDESEWIIEKNEPHEQFDLVVYRRKHERTEGRH